MYGNLTWRQRNFFTASCFFVQPLAFHPDCRIYRRQLSDGTVELFIDYFFDLLNSNMLPVRRIIRRQCSIVAWCGFTKLYCCDVLLLTILDLRNRSGCLSGTEN